MTGQTGQFEAGFVTRRDGLTERTDGGLAGSVAFHWSSLGMDGVRDEN